MPLADVMTFYLAGPIYVTAVSPWLLGERVGWRRWMAVAAGFAGVMIALNPSAQSLTPAAWVAIAGSFLILDSDGVHAAGARHVRHRAGDDHRRSARWCSARSSRLHLGGAELERYRAAGVLGVTAMIAHNLHQPFAEAAPASVWCPINIRPIFWAIHPGLYLLQRRSKLGEC